MLKGDIHLRPLLYAWLACLAGTGLPFQPAAFAGDLSAERQRELVHLVRHDCGSCHGMNLTGGLGPPLTPERLENRPSQELFAIINYGSSANPMPPWQGILSEEEISWIVGQLKAGFPPITSAKE